MKDNQFYFVCKIQTSNKYLKHLPMKIYKFERNLVISRQVLPQIYIYLNRYTGREKVEDYQKKKFVDKITKAPFEFSFCLD